jgi:hypothetical protein
MSFNVFYFLVTECTAIKSIIDDCEDEIEKNPEFGFMEFEGLGISFAAQNTILSFLDTFQFENKMELLSRVLVQRNYKLNFEELVEIVRMLDILGHNRLREYEILLFEAMKRRKLKEYSGLPVSYFDHAFEIGRMCLEENIAKTGNKEFIDFILFQDVSVFPANSAIPIKTGRIFTYLCKYGFLEEAQYRGEVFCLKPDDIFLGFLYACKGGSLHIIKWLYSNFEVDFDRQWDSPLLRAIEYGHVEVAKWLIEKSQEPVTPSRVKFLLEFACKHRNLSMVQWIFSLYENFGPNTAWYFSAFSYACKHQNIEIAQWLFSQGNIDIHRDCDAVFREACFVGNLELARWLCSLVDIDIHAVVDYAFRYACEARHLSIAKCLYAFDGNPIPIGFVDIQFENSCKRGDFEFALWFYEHVFQRNLTQPLLNNAFRASCASGQLEIAQWLCSLGNVDLNLEDE